MNNHGKKNKNNKGSYNMAIGMCIGLAIGAAVGAATQNIGTWLPVGLCLGPVPGYNNAQHKGDDTDDKQ